MSLTIIITASFIPSHPSIQLICETLESLKYTNCKPETPIILAHDYNDNPKYQEYLNNLREFVKDKLNIQVVVRDSFGHLVGNVRHALTFVKTEYMLLMQHDLPFIRQTPDVYKIMEDMKTIPKMKHVRFNQLTNNHNMFDKYWLFGEECKSNNFTYITTPGWSDQNHITTLDYYNNIVMKESSDGSFMESYLNKKILTREDHSKYGTYLVGTVDEPPFIGHRDGRYATCGYSVVVLGTESVFKMLPEMFAAEYKFTFFNPASFVMADLRKAVAEADICITPLTFYKDILKYIQSNYHKKFLLVCCSMSTFHFYGAQPIYDSFSLAAIAPELLNCFKREGAIVQNRVEWATALQAMIDKRENVRIYVGLTFDRFSARHVTALKALKRSYPYSVIVAGIVEDSSTEISQGDREEIVRSCRFVDEVCPRAPVVPTPSFLERYRIDIVATEKLDVSIPCKRIIPLHFIS